MEAQKILVLRLSSLGDVILCSSFLKSVREHFSHAAIDFVVREDLQAIAAALPGVIRVHAIARTAGPADLLHRSARFAGERYAHVFDLHHSVRSRLLTVRLWRQVRPGFDKQLLPRWGLVHLHRDWYAHFGGARSMRARLLEPLRRLGFEAQVHPTELCLPESMRREAQTILRQALPRARRWIGIVPGARWPSKRWPRFAELVAALAENHDLAFAILGSQEEAPLAAQVMQRCGERGVDLAGKLDLVLTAAVLENCELVITNDSGLLHMAEAVGRPVLGFFGPTAPAFGYMPYHPESRTLYHPPPCSPCSKNGARPCHRPTHECMHNISVDESVQAVERMLALGAGRRT